MRRTLALILLVQLVAFGLSSCGSGVKEDPILKLSGEESLAAGKQLIEQKKYGKARRYLTHAFEVEPNSRSGREALLLVADTFYLQGGLTNFIQAESKYRDFLNRFPTSNQAAYAQFQVANSLVKRMEKPDRDQSTTMKALEAYQEVIRLYPSSEYAEEAREQLKLVRENLAEHEFVVGRFNHRFGNPPGAIARFENLLQNYPNYTSRDKAMYFLGLAYLNSRNPETRLKALKTFQQLREEYPESEFLGKIPNLGPLREEEVRKAEQPPEAKADPDGRGTP